MVINKYFKNNEIINNAQCSFYKDLSKMEYDLALKNSYTHDMEIIIMDHDGFNIVKCNKCELYCKKLLNNDILIMNDKVIYTTCDEFIIKGIIE